METQELDIKLEELRRTFGDKQLDPNLKELQAFFKGNFNRGIVKVGEKATFNFRSLFKMSSELRKKFNGDDIQPVTITYLRCDAVFFTYDKHPEFGEEYITFDADWAKCLYLSEIKMSELWKDKSYLLEKNPNEYYLEVNLFGLKDTPFTTYIKDIKF